MQSNTAVSPVVAEPVVRQDVREAPPSGMKPDIRMPTAAEYETNRALWFGAYAYINGVLVELARGF